MISPAILILLLLVLSGLGWLAWQQISLQRRQLKARLLLLVPAGKVAPTGPGPFRRLGDWLAGSPVVGSREVGLLRQNLYAAGFPAAGAVDWYIGFKMVLAGLLLGLALLWVELSEPGLTLGALAVLGASIAGLKGPDALLAQRAASRREAIDRGLPDALDLLVVCGEAGIGLELGLERVAIELRQVHPALATELSVTVSEMRLLSDRLQGLYNMGDRVRLETVRTIASTLSQTLKYGTPLSVHPARHRAGGGRPGIPAADRCAWKDRKMMPAQRVRTLPHALLVLAMLAGSPAIAARPPRPEAAAPTLAPALARAAARAGQWQAAARLWRDLTIARPGDAAAWAGLGHALLALDQAEDAALALDRAATIGPVDAALWLDRGRAALALDDAAAAHDAFAALAAARPDDARAWTGLGIAHDLAGDHAAAQTAYGRALAIDPLNSAAQRNIALSRQLAGRPR